MSTNKSDKSDIVKRAHEEHLMSAFAVVLTHPASFGIELMADLWIDRVEDGRFRIARYDGNMKMTTDFRRVYATVIKEWLGYDHAELILKDRFAPLGVFA